MKKHERIAKKRRVRAAKEICKYFGVKYRDLRALQDSPTAMQAFEIETENFLQGMAVRFAAGAAQLERFTAAFWSATNESEGSETGCRAHR